MIEIELPDGTVLEAPDGADPSTVAKAYLAKQPVRQKTPSIAKVDPTEGMGGVEKAWAAFGSTLPDLSNRLQQASVGMGLGGAGLGDKGYVSPEARPFYEAEATRGKQIQSDIDEAKRLEAPLMATAAGKVGKIGGKVAAGLPLMMLPGANTAGGMAIYSGLLGALEPVATGESGIENTAYGVGGGLLGYASGKAIGAGVTAAKNKVASLALEKSQNAARDATLSAGREAGYVVPPSEVKGGLVSNILERYAGKASVAQEASLRNQKVTNQLIRKELGLPDDVPVTPETLMPIKKAAWDVYDQVKNLGVLTSDKKFGIELGKIAKTHGGSLVKNSGVDDFVAALKQKTISADDAVETIRQLRSDATSHLSPINFDPASRALGKAKREAASALEDLIERNIAPGSGGAELLSAFRDARVTLGKVGTVERAMNESTGDISAKVLARELAKGKPLTGELRKAASFSQAFPRYTQQNVNPIPGGSPLDTLAGTGASVVTGNPGWMALALGRPLARHAALSKAMTRQPNYQPGLLTDLSAELPSLLADPRTAQGLGLLGVYGSQ